MPDGLDLDTVTRIGDFMRGLENLSAETGIDLGRLTAVDLTEDDDEDEPVRIGRVTSDCDTDDVTRYRLQAARPK